MKKVILAVFLLLTIGIYGCDTQYSTTVDQKQAKQQEQLFKDMNNQIGLPDIKEWSEKKMAKEIFELRDNSKIKTYAYSQNQMTGRFVYIGQCLGFGLPYSVQYTNPERVEKYSDSSGGNITVPQADPNGLFMPDGLSATWLQYINSETGKREIIYCEPDVVVTQSKLPKRLIEEWSLPKDY